MSFEAGSLLLEAGLKELMEERGIREADVEVMIAERGREGHLLRDGDTGRLMLKRRMGACTLYAVFKEEAEAVRLYSVFSHRVQLVSESE